MQSALILTLVNLGSIAKLAVLWRCLAMGVTKRLPWFFAMVLLSLARTAIMPTGRLHPYLEFWQATTWPMTILQAAAAIEAFWLLAGHFRGIRNFGWKLIGVILGVSAVAALAVGFLDRGWNNALRKPVLIDEYTALWMVLTAFLSIVFFAQFPNIPVRPNAVRHLKALSLLFGANLVGYSMLPISRGEWVFLTNLIVASGTVLAYGWWALKINRDGEILPFDPQPPMSNDDFDAAERQHRKASGELKRAGSEALRRPFGW
jgi:hypothetical protein